MPTPNSAQVWDACNGQPIGEAISHRARINSVAFSADGCRLATASDDNSARIWEAESGRPLGARLRHRDHVWRAVFSPDGERVLSASRDGTARLWHVWRTADTDTLEAALETFGGWKVTPDGTVVPLPPDQRLAGRRELLVASQPTRPVDHLLRWRFAGPGTASPSPALEMGMTQFVDHEIEWAMQSQILVQDENDGQGSTIWTRRDLKAQIVRDAYSLSPAHPLIHLCLDYANLETSQGLFPVLSEERAEFLRAYGLSRLPDDPAICARAARVLNYWGDAARALAAAEKALALDPLNELAAGERAKALETISEAGDPDKHPGNPQPDE